jgi:predicted kinase
VGAVDSPTDLELKDGTSAGRLDQRLQRLAAGHPSSPDYPDRRSVVREAADVPVVDGRDGGDGDADRVRPLTDAEHAEHVAEVEVRLEGALAAGFSTDIQHTVDKQREVWTDERAALHDAIVGDLYARSSDVPCEGKAILAGGLPGAGKTTVLNEFVGVDLSRYLMINPDLIKVEMARRGLIPTLDRLTPMEASDLAHEESSHIAKRLASRAEGDGKNVIWDITMSTTRSIAERVESLRAAGYSQVDGLFVDIPVEVSIRRAEARHREAHDDFRAGQGFGGRHVPEATILKNADAEWGSGNRRNFEQLKSAFDAWSRYDNSVDDRDPVLVESQGRPGTDMECR